MIITNEWQSSCLHGRDAIVGRYRKHRFSGSEMIGMAHSCVAAFSLDMQGIASHDWADYAPPKCSRHSASAGCSLEAQSCAMLLILKPTCLRQQMPCKN